MPEAHVPTEKLRQVVKGYSAMGIPQKGIAAKLGIDPKTLRLHYRAELSEGKIEANFQVAQSLFNQAISGNTAAAIFWLKTQAGFSERVDFRHLTDDELIAEASRIIGGTEDQEPSETALED